MRELSKSIPRRLHDSNFIRRYFVGNGIDIGGKPDPLALYGEMFPLMTGVKIWDLEDGDAQFMVGVPDNSLDFVTSSHCLEHLHQPIEGLRNWVRIVKPGGYIVILVPDEDLFEQGEFPSTFNGDHKWTFTIWKETSWSAKSINVIEMVKQLGPSARVEKIELINGSYRYHLPRYDQTMTPIGEAAIEIIIRKADVSETEKGMLTRAEEQPSPELRRYYNQYRLDYQGMKSNNQGNPPFSDEGEL
ncbi:Methyltransferase type 11 [Sphingobium chlorophenolicum L-1]|uniref:Methyltransferase type 11 n=1 Tax=Sphingobium chlorophenolicum L-1 TaxID=690566 RepID=F6F0N0_SPHCR|nr:class I SAM-dependent methyltransferase [Sphingobium chlorophenolicum]AEG50352.1 Methyltransferase type 11 [Sphingobium chlorophenolicum L-1]